MLSTLQGFKAVREGEAEPLLTSPLPSSADGDLSRDVARVETVLTYGLFALLGAMTLLPWNALIVQIVWFKVILHNSPFHDTIASWISAAFTASSLFFLAHATYTQASVGLSDITAKMNRIHVSFEQSKPVVRALAAISSIVIVMLTLAISTKVAFTSPELAFVYTLFVTVLSSAASSYLQQAAVALSSFFGPSYMQAIFSGQGGVGVAVASAQLFSALAASVKPAQDSEDSMHEADVKTAAFTFFMLAFAFSGTALIAHLGFTRIPFCRLTLQEAESARLTKPSHPFYHLKGVNAKIRTLGIAVAGIFIITLAVFPAVTASVVSVHDATQNNLFTPTLFVPLGFLIFALGDWLGRALPHWPIFVIVNARPLIMASAARFIFIPLFLICNVSNSAHVSIQSDLLFFVILLLFAISNGLFSTLIMMAGVSSPRLDQEETETAATLLAFYLGLGLAIGSALSFPIRALV